MEKIFAVIFICALFAYCSARANHLHHPKLAEEKILQKIETFRQNLIAKGYDPYNFIDEAFQLKDRVYGIEIDVNATGTIAGPLNFDLSDFTFNIAVGDGYKFTYSLAFPSIYMSVDQYSLDGWISFLPLFGKGDMRTEITGISLKGDGILGTVVEDEILLYLKDITTIMLIDNFSFKVTGWLNDDYRSDNLSKLVTDNIKFIILTQIKKISAKLAAVILDTTKDFRISLEDIIS